MHGTLLGLNFGPIQRGILFKSLRIVAGILWTEDQLELSLLLCCLYILFGNLALFVFRFIIIVRFDYWASHD